MYTNRNRFCLVGGLMLALFCAFPLFAQNNSPLQNGPMVGHVAMREATIWLQTRTAATVWIEYWPTDQPKNIRRSAPLQTGAEHAFTAKCIADEVSPGITYNYRVVVNKRPVVLPYPAQFKTPPLWQWRNDPPPFSIATGSCVYVNEDPYDRPGKPYGSEFEIFTSIYKAKPDLMLWLGDNVYYREVDWDSRSGMYKRYTHDRALPELQPLLANTPHYAIWDDHDYGADNSDKTFIMKETAWEIFRDFWANPTFGIDGQKGCTTAFEYEDVDFFLLDNRYFRDADYCSACPNKTQLGEAQLDWLTNALAASYAPWKVVAVGGQVLSTNKHHETFSNFYAAERDTILNRIERMNVKGVIFLTGDRHFTELSAMKNQKGNWVYDLTASPLTSGVYAGAEKEENAWRVPGTIVTQHNYAMLRFSGPLKQRALEISVYDKDGKVIWTRSLSQSEGVK
jgi:alkaline phosphatase D